MIDIENNDRHELSLEEAKRFISRELTRLAETPAVSEKWPLVIRLTARIVPILPLPWLSRQEMLPRMFWKERDCSWETAGVGVAYDNSAKNLDACDDIWHGLSRILDSDDGNTCIFSGMSFHRTLSGPEWQSFKSFRLILPRFQILKKGEKTFLVCHVVLGEGEVLPLRQIFHQLNSLKWSEQISPFRFNVLSRENHPSYEEWQEILAEVLKNIHHGDVDKVVLTRRTTFVMDRIVDPCFLLGRLLEQNSGGDAFLFQFDNTHAAFGISPEMLYTRHIDKLTSEAIAGTRGRSLDKLKDEKLTAELLHSDKERREHQFVVSSLVKSFRHTCRSYGFDEEDSLLKLPRQQHLLTRLTGRLCHGVTDRELFEMFHPTPSVCGTPADKALLLIHQSEAFDRGWFAGPVGYFSRKHSKLAVAIRSALIDNENLHLYSGAGIVAGSEALSEWEEIEEKIRGYLDIIYGH
ncbi:MAG: isochorismate synthase [Candidatus Omnitrophica bacterium]|nr:isochorismate synthase [Candidatus Omnitrophota bacterium]